MQSRLSLIHFSEKNSMVRITEYKYGGRIFSQLNSTGRIEAFADYIYFFMIYVTMPSIVQAVQCGILV
jgi:hypothetical protein